MPGDFFEAVPAGGDLYLMQRIVHDWDDADATRLLRTVRAAMPAHARLALVEAVVPPGDAPSHAKLLDLNMLVLVGGRERTEGEYRALLAAAGLALRRVLPATSAASVIEAVPSDAAAGDAGDNLTAPPAR
jgi:O-methyltransferase domain